MSSVDIDKLTAECQEMLPLLSAYIDDELDEKKRARVESHLEQCAFCRLALEEMTESSRSYRAILPLLVPAGLGEGIWLRLSEGTASAEPGSSAQPDPSAEAGVSTQAAESGDPASSGETGLSGESAVSPQAGPPPPPPPLSGDSGTASGFMISTDPGMPKPKSARRDPLPRQLALIAVGAAIVLAFGALLASGAFDRHGGSGDDGTAIVVTTASSLYVGAIIPDITTSSSDTTVTTWPITTTTVTTWPITTTTVTVRPTTTTSVTQAPDTAGPPTPAIVYPVAGEVVEGNVVTLRWKSVKDTSGVTYWVEVESFSDKAGTYVTSQSVKGIGGTSLTHTIASTRERWRVTAVDGAGNASAPSAWAKYAQSSPTPTTTSSTIILY